MKCTILHLGGSEITIFSFYFVWSVATSCLFYFTGIVYVYKCFSFDFEMQCVSLSLRIMISVCL